MINTAELGNSINEEGKAIEAIRHISLGNPPDISEVDKRGLA